MISCLRPIYKRTGMEGMGDMMTRCHVLVVAAGLLIVAPVAGAVDLARVNGKAITDEDLQTELGALNEGQRKSVLSDQNTRRQVLMGLIDKEVLNQQAEKEKLDQTSEFKSALAAFRKQYLANRLLEKNLAAKVTESAAKKYYELHKVRYSTDQAHVQHILAPSEQEARELFQKARQPDADFQALAERHSRDRNAKNNRGDIGFISYDSPFVPEFKEAALSASEGEIVGPVKTAYGYHLIKVLKKKVGKAKEYSEVELQVMNDLRQDLVEKYLGNLKRLAKVQVDDKALNSAF